MLTRLFVTGTDTNIGKTVVTRALLQVFNREGTIAVGYELLAKEESQIDFIQMTNCLNKLSHKADRVIVDGKGGWRALSQDNAFYSDWVVKEKLPVILVVGIQAGCVNHAILTAQSIINDGLPLIGWIPNRINPGLAHYAIVLEKLRCHMPAPQLGEIPYLLRPEERDLSHYLDISVISAFDN
ncbi:ATP-dependent dethiobiotin synthetase BioD [Xenorhabdus cabanillasii]|uniref:ATP-dependent dethiobiotin synthetase BioD n=1 Tax=Xenorhabdus cabanillasii JM26 TaxID=1427517 RepID=W1IUU0_9GAMM|nr:ATP-dependent dethiobiotin synthetase BioD [Xenorhabdus cabanillasii]PHM77944.1 dethiobiotin synthetase [Xenorhabdus cabanillasii JM26]CDL81603.1 putative dethiobiotin synthetase 2 [Xenorhabdus cabanillasii JM26]